MSTMPRFDWVRPTYAFPLSRCRHPSLPSPTKSTPAPRVLSGRSVAPAPLSSLLTRPVLLCVFLCSSALWNLPPLYLTRAYCIVSTSTTRPFRNVGGCSPLELGNFRITSAAVAFALYKVVSVPWCCGVGTDDELLQIRLTV